MAFAQAAKVFARLKTRESLRLLKNIRKSSRVNV